MPYAAPTHQKDSSRAKQKIWQRQHDQTRTGRTQRGYGNAWRKVRMRILVRDNGQCQHCGTLVGRSGHVDHIVPMSMGGEWGDPENLQTLCAACHSKKTATDKACGR